MTLAEGTTPTFAPGSLVKARGRDWVVLPQGDDPDVLLLRPLGGSDDDATGLYLPLERGDVASAEVPPPSARPEHLGDAVAARLLRDAVRFGFRSAAGPFRSVARLAVEPRPYQLVPLLMALRLDPVRLLIADDVGIGKTIEACLIARELLDRGEIRRLAVLCPPHLCEQWQSELRSKFNLDAEVVRPGTVAALERRVEREQGRNIARTIFQEYPYTVVSIDYIKSDRRRDDFVRTCPELVIVDEAHGVAESAARTAQQQRHALVAELARDPGRHLIFTTATPHSGDQSAFASLVGLLVPDLEAPVAELAFTAREDPRVRERLARHFVQRRRADVQDFNGTTDFPKRLTGERTYRLTPEYRALLQRVLDYAREIVRDARGTTIFQRRISWWAALALLRCVASSPAAAAAALRTRTPRPTGDDARLVDALGAAAVLDLTGSDEAAQDDSTPGADPLASDDPTAAERGRLLRLARDAEALGGDKDPKLAEAAAIVEELLRDGFAPIVFCRYVATAHYVADALAKRLKGVRVEAVTGELPPEERERKVAELGEAERRVLVATDCLSEGVNLQSWFDAVVHYDLAWNPTRHEQREGRVDRYGQSRPEVRAVLLYGQDNRVDGVVLEVLLRKAETIRKTLGVSVPVPADTDRVLEAIFDQLFDRPETDYRQLELFVGEQGKKLDAAWEAAAERERRTRAVFAQHAMKPEEVAPEFAELVEAIGSGDDLARFVEDAVTRLAVRPSRGRDGQTLAIEVERLPGAVQRRLDWPDGKRMAVAFEPNAPDGATYVTRTHRLIEALGSYLLDTALDLPDAAAARRAGATRTTAVRERTVVLLLRGRYVIHETRGGEMRELLAEEALLLGMRGDPAKPEWLPREEVADLVARAEPVANVAPPQASMWVQQAVDGLPALAPELGRIAAERADALLASHQRVRAAASLRGVRDRVEAKPHDLLGLYVFMPAPVAVR